MVWKHGAMGYDAMVPLHDTLPYGAVVFDLPKTTKSFSDLVL
jgi:hypothetical protein